MNSAVARKPKARPSPRFGLHGHAAAPATKATTSTALAAPAARALPGSLGRRTWLNLTRPTLPSSKRGRHPLQVLEGDPDRGAVGTHLHARGALGTVEAEVALGGQLHRLAVGPLLPAVDHDDVVPRAPVGAVAAADAGRLVDRALERPDRPGDGPRRAIHHADGIRALVAGRRHEPVAILLPLADEAGLAAMGVRATADALVAARARREVDQEDALAVDETGVHRHLQVFGGHGIARRGPPELEPGDHLRPERFLEVRIARGEGLEVGLADADDLHVLEGLQGEGPRLVEEQRRLSRVVPLAQVGNRHVRGAGTHARLHVAAPDEIEAVRRGPLLRDHLPRLEREQLRFLLHPLHELVVHLLEQGHAAEVPRERALAVALVEELAELLGRGQQHAQARKTDLQQREGGLGAHGGGDGISREGAGLAEDLARLQDRPLAGHDVGRHRGEDDGAAGAPAPSDHPFRLRARSGPLRRGHVGAPPHLGPGGLAGRGEYDLDRALDDAVRGVAVLAFAQDDVPRVERDDVDVLPYLLDDLVAGLLGDPREDRKAAELLRLGRHHDLETRVHFGLRSASRARTVTSSCSRNSSLSGPRNSAGREVGGRAGARAPARSMRSSSTTPRPRSSATRAAAERTPDAAVTVDCSAGVTALVSPRPGTLRGSGVSSAIDGGSAGRGRTRGRRVGGARRAPGADGAGGAGSGAGSAAASGTDSFGRGRIGWSQSHGAGAAAGAVSTGAAVAAAGAGPGPVDARPGAWARGEGAEAAGPGPAAPPPAASRGPIAALPAALT